GLPVFGETCPPYLELASDVYEREDGYLYVVNPPIRGPADRDRLWRAIQEGTLDVIGTDHCCYTLGQKGRDKSNFDATPAGFPGVETLLPFLYTRGVAEGRISLARLVELISANPARIFGLYPRKGVIAVGSDADIVVYDPSVETVSEAAALHMGTDFLPFEKMRVVGRVCRTILRGATVYADGKFMETNRGRFVPGRLEEPARC
ncbi:MAG: amidohydrolase family protein, partial [Armatimonadetes bacterium]|nr:amidohydrolase family protein [Armatimonadota bacterium]